MARKFFLVAAGMLMLALSYHFGASTATAQAPGNPVVASFGTPTTGGAAVVTANGDLYVSSAANWIRPWVHVANVFAGGPTPALHESWGQVKARYQNTPGMTVTPGSDKQ
jgi:hypothetical protein